MAEVYFLLLVLHVELIPVICFIEHISQMTIKHLHLKEPLFMSFHLKYDNKNRHDKYKSHQCRNKHLFFYLVSQLYIFFFLLVEIISSVHLGNGIHCIYVIHRIGQYNALFQILLRFIHFAFVKIICTQCGRCFLLCIYCSYFQQLLTEIEYRIHFVLSRI